MSSGISFPLKYQNFICIPYSSSLSSYLNRFDLIDVIDENGENVHYDELERDIRDAGRLSDANIFKTYLAIDANYNRKHPEIKRTGGMVFDAFIVEIVQELNRLCGCKYLFLFAINDKKLIKYYINRMDFQELPEVEETAVVEYLKTYSNKSCKFLFQDIANM